MKEATGRAAPWRSSWSKQRHWRAKWEEWVWQTGRRKWQMMSATSTQEQQQPVWGRLPLQLQLPLLVARESVLLPL